MQLLVPLGPRVVGLHASAVTTVDATKLMVACELFPSVAVTVAAWLVAKVPVVALNAAVVDPAAIVTDVGTVSVALVFVSATVLPPAGAAWFRVTVQLLVPLGPRVVGLHAKAVTCMGVNVIVTFCDPFPNVAVSVADWVVAKVPVVALKVAVVADVATVTDVGTVRVELVFVSETVLPPVGAA